MTTQMDKLMDYFEKASETTQRFIATKDLQNEIIKIENKFNLTNDETTVIQEESIGVLLGIIDKQAFKEEAILVLRNRSAAEAEKIIKEVEDKILIHK